MKEQPDCNPGQDGADGDGKRQGQEDADHDGLAR